MHNCKRFELQNNSESVCIRMDSRKELNHFLVDVFNEILKTEEMCVAAQFSDLSLREIHVIEAVCRAADGKNNSSASIASALRITAGTLTTTVSLLEKKGYLKRYRDEEDRRFIRICPTEAGRAADSIHKGFHEEMVDHVLRAIPEEEAAVFVRALKSISAFFKNKHKEKKGGNL